MIEIDGSQGEGGGQILRSALALSTLTREAFTMSNIRANRSKPGLRPQHLKAVEAAAAISKARVGGAVLNSSYLAFEPGEIHSNRYRFDITTAGAATLVLQTILLPLSQASAASSVILTGGTHVPWSPIYHYLELHWLPVICSMGWDATINLQKAGFNPQGGGRIDGVIRPSMPEKPLQLVQRGALQSIQGLSAVANLDVTIADRQKRQALNRLKSLGVPLKIKTLDVPSPGKGTFLLLQATFENGSACYTALGAPGKPAERVADEAIDAILEHLDTNAAIDQFLADQLLLPCSLAKGVSEFSTSRVTSHLLTNAAIIQTFLPVQIIIQGELDHPGSVTVRSNPQSSHPRSFDHNEVFHGV